MVILQLFIIATNYVLCLVLLVILISVWRHWDIPSVLVFVRHPRVVNKLVVVQLLIPGWLSAWCGDRTLGLGVLGDFRSMGRGSVSWYPGVMSWGFAWFSWGHLLIRPLLLFLRKRPINLKNIDAILPLNTILSPIDDLLPVPDILHIIDSLLIDLKIIICEYIWV